MNLQEGALAKLMKPRTNAKRPTDVRSKHRLTMHGFLIDYLEQNGPTPLDTLRTVLAQVYPDLRTKGGSKYRGSPHKSLLGALTNKELFSCENDLVHVSPLAIIQEAQKTKQSLRKAQAPAPVRSSRKLRKLATLLQGLRTHLSTQPQFVYAIRRPLKRLQGSEELLAAAEVVGFERLIGLVQGFHFGRKYLIMQEDSRPRKKDPMEISLQGILSKLATIEASLTLVPSCSV